MLSISQPSSDSWEGRICRMGSPCSRQDKLGRRSLHSQSSGRPYYPGQICARTRSSTTVQIGLRRASCQTSATSCEIYCIRLLVSIDSLDKLILARLMVYGRSRSRRRPNGHTSAPGAIALIVACKLARFSWIEAITGPTGRIRVGGRVHRRQARIPIAEPTAQIYDTVSDDGAI